MVRTFQMVVDYLAREDDDKEEGGHNCHLVMSAMINQGKLRVQYTQIQGGVDLCIV